MRPAWSVILLTTLIGAGQGLFLALFAAELAGLGGSTLFVPAAAVSLALLGAGLAASFFHLGRPERAWRSAAMWRSSWLSREVIALPLFMALAAGYGLAHWLGMLQGALVVGAAAALAALALYVCTGMIYACIKFLQEWASPLTVVNFLLLGCASGLSAAAALSAYTFTVPYTDLLPDEDEVARWIRSVEEAYPDLTTLQRAIDRWYVDQ